MRYGDHVRVDVVFSSLSPRTKHAIDGLSAVLAMAFSVIVILLSIHYVAQAWNANEGSPNPGGIDHRYIVKALIPIGFALLFIQSLSLAIRSTLAFRRV
jgi:TRAP-type mannitol/chloroaromatic compound transport system permease small subunit